MKEVKDRVVVGNVTGAHLSLSLLFEDAAPPLAEQLENGIEDFASDILCLLNPIAAEVAVVGVVTAEVSDHAKDASCNIPLCFLPVNQPLRGLHLVD